MKHIFFIHSHTVFLTALGVIDYKKIASEDVVFITYRNYKNDLLRTYKSVDISKEEQDTFYIVFSWSHRNFFYNKEQYQKSIAFFDSFLKDVANEGYNLYVPQLQAIAFQIAATNPLCKECFFIQEGGRTMYPLLTGKISLAWRIYNAIVLRKEKRLWKCTNWFPNNNTPYNRPITAYAFDKEYFSQGPKEIILVTWPKIDVDTELDVNRPIFLLEGAVEHGQVEKHVYVNAVRKLINSYAEENNYIKFHPKQSEEVRQLYINMFHEKGCNVEELPMDVPFELILAKYRNLKLYGFGTSLLFFGQALGHKVVSNETDLLVSKRYRIYVKGLQMLK